MLEAALDQEVSEAIDHERVSLSNNGLDNLVFLLRSSDLEFLLEENGGLLVVVADNLVNNVLPIAIDVTVEETTIIEGLGGGQICLSFGSNCLKTTKLAGHELNRKITSQQRVVHGVIYVRRASKKGL